MTDNNIIDWLDFNTARPQKEIHHDTINVEQIKSDALLRIEDILFHLFPAGHKRHNKFYIGDISGNKGKSLVVELEGDRIGQWHDFATGEGGDIFKLWGLVHGMSTNSGDFIKVVSSLSEHINGTSTAVRKQPSAKPQPPTDELGSYTAKWDYTDAKGNLIACVYRYDIENGKEFRPWDAVNKKHATPNPRPLYRIPDIINSDVVVLVEGEKCADSLANQNIVATTAMNGAQAPLDKTDWSPLQGKQVIIWPDNDQAGKDYAHNLSSYLQQQQICTAVVANIPEGKPAKWDAADACHEGFHVHSFIASYIAKEEAEQQEPAITHIDPRDWQGKPPKREWIIDEWLPRGYVTALYGDGGVGKSLLAQQLMACLATGKSWLGLRTTPMRVYGLMCEDDGNELWRRQYSINQTLGLRMEDLNNIRFVSRVGSNNLLMTFDGKDAGKHTELFHKLMADITEFAPDVVILDTAADLFGGNEINRTQVRQFVQNVCGNIARSINGAVVLCAHPSDSGIQRNTGTGGSTAWNNTLVPHTPSRGRGDRP